MKWLAFAGGVGGAKLVLGLSNILDPRDLTIVVNTHPTDLCDTPNAHISDISALNLTLCPPRSTPCG